MVAAAWAFFAATMWTGTFGSVVRKAPRGANVELVRWLHVQVARLAERPDDMLASIPIRRGQGRLAVLPSSWRFPVCRQWLVENAPCRSSNAGALKAKPAGGKLRADSGSLDRERVFVPEPLWRGYLRRTSRRRS